jgi:hypothetical protein
MEMGATLLQVEAEDCYHVDGYGGSRCCFSSYTGTSMENLIVSHTMRYLQFRMDIPARQSFPFYIGISSNTQSQKVRGCPKPLTVDNCNSVMAHCIVNAVAVFSVPSPPDSFREQKLTIAWHREHHLPFQVYNTRWRTNIIWTGIP